MLVKQVLPHIQLMVDTVTGTLVSPSHFDVSGVTQETSGYFYINLEWGCTASQTVTCYPQCVTQVTPTFNPLATVVQVKLAVSMPTTSLNGVTGSWSPAINNLSTTTYTFHAF
ncbi:MAG: hypothetical protein U0T80_03890 [Flavobacteriaceae bacterium]